jgi:hypothetical protein
MLPSGAGGYSHRACERYFSHVVTFFLQRRLLNIEIFCKDSVRGRGIRMSTINSKRIIAEILRNNGSYKSDPEVYAVLEYENIFDGRAAYKLYFDKCDIEVEAKNIAAKSDDILCLFENGQVTDIGIKWLSIYESLS